MVIESAVNDIIVQVNGTLQESFHNMIARANLNPGTQVNPNDYVNIVGRVVSVPRSVCKRMDYKGFKIHDLEVGDRLIFSYMVIGSLTELIGGDFSHTNSVVIKGKEYWRCDIRHAFAVIKSDGEIKMLNDYVMITPPQPPTKLFLPTTTNKVKKWAVEASVEAIGRQNINSFALGETVLVDYKKVQHYKMKDSVFAIIESRHIYGKMN